MFVPFTFLIKSTLFTFSINTTRYVWNFFIVWIIYHTCYPSFATISDSRKSVYSWKYKISTVKEFSYFLLPLCIKINASDEMSSLPDFPVQFCFPQIQATSLCLQRLLTLVYALQSKSFVDLVRQLLQDLQEPNSWNGYKDCNISAYEMYNYYFF